MKTRRRADATPVVGNEAVLYTRVSSREQHLEGFSIEAQLKACRSYASGRGLVVVREFTDVETAKHTGRAEFEAMVAFVSRRPACGALIVEKTDRLYRNLRDWVTVDDLGVELHLVKENAVISDKSRSSEKFVHGIKVLVAKQYVDNLGEEAAKGLLEKAEQGHWPSVAPIGYLNNRESRRIEIDPERAPLVAQLFEWCSAGELSLRALTVKARAAGLDHRRSGRPLAKSEIHRLLRIRCTWASFSGSGSGMPVCTSR